MFTTEQLRQLNAPLDARHVREKPNSRGARYLEGWFVADQANRIFGFGMWDRELTRLQEVDCTERPEKGKFDLTYIATIRVTVRSETGSATHTGTGVGVAQNRTLAEGHEQAAKTAETDALKRALAFGFGNQFGLALYGDDKSRVVDPRQYFALKTTLEIELGLESVETPDLTALVERVHELQKAKTIRAEHAN